MNRGSPVVALGGGDDQPLHLLRQLLQQLLAAGRSKGQQSTRQRRRSEGRQTAESGSRRQLWPPISLPHLKPVPILEIVWYCSLSGSYAASR